MSIKRNGVDLVYTSRRRWPAPRGASSSLELRIGERIEEPDPFEHFLSARWGLYTLLGRRLAFAPVAHAPWPLHRAEVLEFADELHAVAGYPAPPERVHAMWSPGVDVAVARPRFVA